MQRQVLVLPITFFGSIARRLSRVVGDSAGVVSHMDGGSGMTGGPRGGPRGGLVSSAGRRVGGEGGGAGLAHPHLPTHPSPPRCDSFARAVIVRILPLEAWEDVFGAISRPKHL